MSDQIQVEGYADGGNADQGIYPKYVVFKHPSEWEMNKRPGIDPEFVARGLWPVPNTNIRYEKLDMELVNDFVFVLKPISDKHARIALAAYAESVKEEKPQLSRDIYEVLSDF